MKKLLFLLLLINTSTGVFSQSGHMSVNPQTGRVSNFNAVYNFSGSYIYDYDLKTYSNVIRMNSIIAVQMDETGTGRFIIKVVDKTIFEIEQCIQEDNRFSFTLVNTNGYKVKAFLLVKNNYISSFWLNKDSDGTALVLYNPDSR